jgi:hypothetical protein
MAKRVFIFCDDASHAGRFVAVTNFVPIQDGRWTEQYASRAARKESGTTLDGNSPFSATSPTDLDGRELRSRYQLVCRKCRGRSPVVAREQTLFTVLNVLQEHGVDRISLAGFAASMALQSDVGRADPEPGQG